MKIIIVGGVAGGASCAARLRRLDEKAEILMVERGPYVSYANCGLPYHVGGAIEQESSLLVATEQTFREQFAIDVRTRCEVVGISAAQKTVDLKNHVTGEVTTETYDKLVLSPGAAPIRPPLPGIDLPGIFSVRTVPDARNIRAWLDRDAAEAIWNARVHGNADGDACQARRGGRRWLHRPGDGGKPDPSRAGRDAGRAAQSGHAPARSGNGAPGRALHGQARRPPRAQRRRGRLRAVRRWRAGSPHGFGQASAGGHRDPGDWRAPGDGAGQDGRHRDRPARRHPRRRADAHQRPRHLRRRRRGRGQGFRHRPMDADPAGRAGQSPGPDRGRSDRRARLPFPRHTGHLDLPDLRGRDRLDRRQREAPERSSGTRISRRSTSTRIRTRAIIRAPNTSR